MLAKTVMLATVAAAGLLASCAASVATLPAGYAMKASEGIAMGRVIGLSPAWKAFDTGVTTLLVRNQATSEPFEIAGEQEGGDTFFAKGLPAGRYTLVRLSKGNMTSEPPAHFEVSAGTITYVGTLRFNKGSVGASVAASMLSQMDQIVGKWVVEDDYAAAVTHFREKHPTLSQDVTKSLMVLGE